MTVCKHCGYTWDYGGQMENATCPSCQYKTPADYDGAQTTLSGAVERSEHTPDPSPEPDPQPTDDDTDGASDPIERAIRDAADRWDDDNGRLEQRKNAARAVLEAVREQDMSKSEILDEIHPDHPIDGQSERTWWRRNVAEGTDAPLKQVAEYSNATKKWTWVDDE